ncbi:hypothetical protein [Mycobacterium sp. C31M]
MIGALSTGGAAISALVFYRLDARKKREAQARLIRGSLHPEPNDVFEVSVTNDSDLPISLELLFVVERDFGKSLLANEVMETRDEVQFGPDSNPNFMVWRGHGAYRMVDHKEQLLGFSGGGGAHNIRYAIGDERSRLMSGSTERFTVKYHLYRISARYWLYFFDASGIAWELELLPAPSSPGRLVQSQYRHSANSLGARSERRMRPIGYARTAKRRIAAYIERRRWLFAHRKEETTPYPRIYTPEQWEPLEAGRRKNLQREEAPDQDQ